MFAGRNFFLDILDTDSICSVRLVFIPPLFASAVGPRPPLAGGLCIL